LKSLRVLLATGLSFGLAATALAQKTDVVLLFNGDRVTGEIKSYASGRLTLDTDIASNVSIKWNRIVSITSDKQFEIETPDGLYHYGTLAPSTPPGKLDLVSAGKTETLDFMQVIRLSPIYQTFWRRFSGSLDLGFNYQQANQYVQFTFNANASMRKPAFAMFGTISSFFTSQQGVPSSQRANLDLGYQKFLKDRWSLLGGVGLDRNLDLGLDLRASLTAAVGRDLYQTNRTLLEVFAGLTGSREVPVEGSTTSNLAAVLALRYSSFTYDFPKLTLSGQLPIIPYLTDSGRARLEAQALA
jgi:hypothetical protein